MTKPLDSLPSVLTVPEAAEILRIGRSAAYEAARRGELPTIKIGRKGLVPRRALERLLDGDAPGADAAQQQHAE